MSDPRISSFGPNLLHTLSPKSAPGPSGGKDFKQALGDMIKKVNQDQAKADQAVTDLAVGNRRSLHEVMIQMEKADLSFRMLLAVRGKVVQAYQEISRMSF